MEKDIKYILSSFGIYEQLSITQIYKSAWEINDTYVLKTNDNKEQLDRSILINRLFLSEGIPVIEYIDTTDKKPYVYFSGKYWCLMKRIKGNCFDPFNGELKHNGIMLGKAVAGLHKALKNIENKVSINDSDFFNEFTTWIAPELEKNNILFNDGVISDVVTFLSRDYKTLPRQLIHRDIHTSNLS